MKKLRLQVFKVIEPNKAVASIVFEVFIIALILVSVVLIIVDTFPDIPDSVRRVFDYVEIFSIAVFTVEYLLRLFTADYLYQDLPAAKARRKYVFSFMAIIDFMAILPFYIPFLLPIDLRVIRLIRLLRLVRLFKVNRYTGALLMLGGVMKRKSSQLLSSMLIMLILIVIASILMYSIEHEAQPDVFETAASGFWWSVATLTRTPFGSLHPVTAAGRLLGSGVSVLGVGLIAVPTGIISSGFIERASSQNEKAESETAEHKYCRHCGQKIK